MFEELDEAAAVFWVLGETGVDFPCGRPPCAQGLRLDGGDVLLLHGLRMVKMCSGLCSNRARSLAAIWWPMRL